ncbi:hypothetical protein M9H77_37021 [Catharanthus roseus]|uniref:Uncharacterized protein n=1 Tax=Catharanthus roseus TaxID=4058 RepID=A0ACB9ZUT0_CATRO|nr:hypothetical protein M9H77_37021 [Catharanthus roseus]
MSGAEAMAVIVEILKPILSEVGEFLNNNIKKQISYMCCYSCNVNQLDDEISNLEIDKKRLDEKIKIAKVEWGKIKLPADVEDWLNKVKEIQKQSNEMQNEDQKSNLPKWIPFIHYSLSRKARKTIQAALERQNPSFETIAYRVGASELEPIPITSEIFLLSRKLIENEIIDALNKDVYLIGICGMGGIVLLFDLFFSLFSITSAVRKTTIAENIEKKAREKTSKDSNLKFDRVVKVVVSQEPDPLKVQQKIAERLDLQLAEENLEIRAERLHASLKSLRSVLVILDDVWEPLNIQKIGIPSQSVHPGCKLLLTSRNRDALTLTAKDAKIFSVDVLSEQESWILLKKNAGDLIDSSDLYQVAKDVLQECKGLPLAIVAIGCALRDRGKASWENALLGLQQAMPENVPNVLKGVYGPLLWSLDRLESEEQRYLFLLCCLFPEDSEILLQELVIYGMGLRIFKGTKKLAEAKNRVESIVEILISRNLLLASGGDNWGNRLVKMHDVIRDMGIWIAPKWKQVFLINHEENEWPTPKDDQDCYQNYTGISVSFSTSDIDAPEFMDWHKLELLRIHGKEWDGLKVGENILSGMTGLKVLEAFGIKTLPSSIHLLQNLRTLYLANCSLQISVIGELKNLEILWLQWCELHDQVLSKDFGGLKKLKKLDFSQCGLLRIAFGFLSGLVQLEELILIGTFYDWWEDEEINNNNASLAELDSLSHLTTLCVTINNPNAIPKMKPHWVHKLKMYSLSVARPDFISSNILRFQKSIWLGDRELTPLRDWFYDHLVREAKYLDLCGSVCIDVFNKLIPSGYKNLTCLKFWSVNNLEYLSHSFIDGGENRVVFPALKTLVIEDSTSLEEICKGSPPVGSFKILEEIRLVSVPNLVHLWKISSQKLYLSSLRTVRVDHCDSLSYLFQLSIVESLNWLEELEIKSCPVLEEIFKKEEGEMEITINEVKLPKLYQLHLINLPSLQDFCKGIARIEVPSLQDLIIINSSNTRKEDNYEIRQHFFFDQHEVPSKSLQLFHIAVPPLSNIKFNLSGLQKLRISDLHHFKCLFSPSILSGFPNLESIEVKNCSELEQVIGTKEIDDHVVGEETITKTILLPRLEILKLTDLPKLVAFCHKMVDLELPSLTTINIESCSVMETFFHSTGNLELPSLERLHIRGCPVMETFFHSTSNLELPSLERLHIGGCPVMETFVSSIINNVPGGSKHVIQPFICQKVFCPKLRSLSLENLKVVTIFSPLLLRSLTNIEGLELSGCRELKEVIANEDHQERPVNMLEQTTLFPKLKYFSLEGLPKIHIFCHLKNILELPSLEYVTIDDCPILETFSLGSLCLPSFKKLFGLSDPDFATKFFFNKEKSYLGNINCFTISVSDLSFNAANRRMHHFDADLDLVLDSRFLTIAKLKCFRPLEMRGKFGMGKLLLGVPYEIILIISDIYSTGGEESIPFKLTLSLCGGEAVEFEREVAVINTSSGVWTEILLGEFKRDDADDQVGELEFSFSICIGGVLRSLLVKGVLIRLKQ